jgi:phosphonate transport system substrate-binding protein
MEDRETVVKQFRPMTDYLQQHLGISIEYVYADSYADILEKFRNGDIDLAYLRPLPYVELRASHPQAEPLIHFKEASGQTTYTCGLVVFADSTFPLENLLDKKLALTQPLSTCGYLSANGLLRQHGSNMESNNHRYLGKHDAVALAVVQGPYDAGVLKTSIGKKYAHLGLKVIEETAPLPSFALVGNKATLKPELMNQIRHALIAIDSEGKHREMLADWGDNIRYGAIPSDDTNYDVIRELLEGVTIPDEGNF